jgi:hypothetical protein
LTPLKIHSIVASAYPDDDGMVVYSDFAHTAATMLEGFLKPLTQEEGKFMSEAARMSGSDLLPGLQAESVESALMAAFQGADPDATGSLPYNAVADAINGCGLNLSERQVQSLAAAGLMNESVVDYVKVVEVAWDLLILVSREAYVTERLAAL